MKLKCIGGPIDGHELEFSEDQNHIDLYKPNSLQPDINGWKPTSAPIATYVIHTYLGVPLFAAHKSVDPVNALRLIIYQYKNNGRS